MKEKRDIVESLREDFSEAWKDSEPYSVIKEYEEERHTAADEIERLRLALEFYADQFCEMGRDDEGCGKHNEYVCGGCKARAAITEQEQR